MSEILYREALNQAMVEEMCRDPDVFLMGEEVGYYNGAYKVSQGMLDRFGPERVIDTPISESGFCGVGVGAAMAGLRPIIELMTWSFSLVAIDQIVNHAAQIAYMSGGQFRLPIVFRGCGGAAHQLAATHSHSLESWYANIPGLKVVMPGTPYDAKGLLKSAIRDDNPVIFIENEILYGRRGEVPEEEYLIPIGEADVKREGTDLTIVAYSRMLEVAREAADRLAEEGIEAEIVDPRTIRPLDTEAILGSVRKTNRCVVVHEAKPFAGVGAEIAARIQEEAFDALDAPVIRVTGADVPMPYNHHLEQLAVPDAQRVLDAAHKVLYR